MALIVYDHKKGVILLEDSQLLRGVLEGCVLAIIKRGETYGYEIIAKLEAAGFNNIQEGTLYPVLTRLEKKGLITCRKAKSPFGPIRKYYSISEEGKVYYESFVDNYEKLVKAANIAMKGENQDEK